MHPNPLLHSPVDRIGDGLAPRARLRGDGGIFAGVDLQRVPEVAPLKVKGHVYQTDQPGTSTKGPMTAAKAAPELMPKTATATAMANSKLLLAAVKESVAVLG